MTRPPLILMEKTQAEFIFLLIADVKTGSDEKTKAPLRQ